MFYDLSELVCTHQFGSSLCDKLTDLSLAVHPTLDDVLLESLHDFLGGVFLEVMLLGTVFLLGCLLQIGSCTDSLQPSLGSSLDVDSHFLLVNFFVEAHLGSSTDCQIPLSSRVAAKFSEQFEEVDCVQPPVVDFERSEETFHNLFFVREAEGVEDLDESFESEEIAVVDACEFPHHVLLACDRVRVKIDVLPVAVDPVIHFSRILVAFVKEEVYQEVSLHLDYLCEVVDCFFNVDLHFLCQCAQILLE